MSTARAKLVESIEQLAAEAFKNHQVTCLKADDVYRHFDCRNKNGSSNYQFHIFTLPGRLVITGDIGDLMLCRMYDMFAWAPQAVHSIDYFAEKVTAGKVKDDYDPDVAQEAIDEAMKDDDVRISEDLDITDVSNPHTTLVEMYDSGAWDGCDFPSVDNWSPNFLWCREAFKWFCANHLSRVPPSVASA